MSDLVEKVARALKPQYTHMDDWDDQDDDIKDFWRTEARAAIAVVLHDMQTQFPLPNWPQFHTVLKMYASENGVSLDE